MQGVWFAVSPVFRVPIDALREMHVEHLRRRNEVLR